MNPAVPVIVALLILAILVFGRLWLQRSRAASCPNCHYPPHHCICPGKCLHRTTTRPQWSQDGWVSKCDDCNEVLYLGDDYSGGPKR